jgi:preflagellin peptidase FlaK
MHQTGGRNAVTEWVDAVRVAVAVGGLAVASYTDVKKREVPDGLWYALALAALPLMALDFDARFGGTAWLLALPVGAVFAVAFTGGELFPIFPGDTLPEGEIVLSEAQRRLWRIDKALSATVVAVSLAVLLWAPGLDLGRPVHPLLGPQAIALSACLMFGAGLFFFITGALFGGGDAKGFMVLALLFPTAPALAGLPVMAPASLAAQSLPFALVVFFNAGLMLVVAGPVVYAAVSLRRGHFRFPDSLMAVPKPVGQVDLSRDFVMGSLEDGQFKRRFLTRQGTHSDAKQKEALAFLQQRGDPVVFVAPKLPFMVYMLLGLVVAVVLTSPLYWIPAAG